ncbi:MAG: hypothetical protein WA871_15220 [Candidatus Acidiferrales bacterium]
METIDYQNVNEELLSAIPELASRYEKEAEWRANVGGRPGPYDVICYVLKPLLRHLLDSDNDPALLKRIFSFFEQMARSSDIQVVNLLHVGIFESLIGERDRLVTAWKYMGEESKNVARRAAHARRRDHNLPDAV